MKMLVVDDHAVVRQGLAALLEGRGAAREVLQAADTRTGLALAEAHADLAAVLLDLNLPDGDGMAAIAEFARVRPDVPVIILSASEDPALVRRALDLGALGYVSKSASPEALAAAVQLVMSGGVYVPPFMVDAPAGAAGLTGRQGEVLAALADGLSNKQIGLRFGLSEKTVKAHVGAIFRQLGVANRTQAVTWALGAGLIPRPASPKPVSAADE